MSKIHADFGFQQLVWDMFTQPPNKLGGSTATDGLQKHILRHMSCPSKNPHANMPVTVMVRSP
jgi:hypothetical protein